MLGFGRKSLRVLATGLPAAGCAALIEAAPPVPRYAQLLTLRPGVEWRFHPVLVDLNGEGHLDLVATARLVKPALYMVG